jgi:hypothetical protein
MRNDAPSFRLGTDAEEATPLLSASIEVKLENYRESAVGMKVKEGGVSNQCESSSYNADRKGCPHHASEGVKLRTFNDLTGRIERVVCSS